MISATHTASYMWQPHFRLVPN